MNAGRSATGRVRGATIRRAAAGLILAVFTASCSTSPEHAVGDCVTIERRLLDHRLEAADCAAARGSFDPSQRTYRVDSVLELDASCPTLQGFFPVSFAHEPDGVVYCLSMATG